MQYSLCLSYKGLVTCWETLRTSTKYLDKNMKPARYTPRSNSARQKVVMVLTYFTVMRQFPRISMVLTCLWAFGAYSSFGQTNGDSKRDKATETVTTRSGPSDGEHQGNPASDYKEPVFNPKLHPIETDSILRMKARAERGDARDYNAFMKSQAAFAEPPPNRK